MLYELQEVSYNADWTLLLVSFYNFLPFYLCFVFFHMFFKLKISLTNLPTEFTSKLLDEHVVESSSYERFIFVHNIATSFVIFSILPKEKKGADVGGDNLLCHTLDNAAVQTIVLSLHRVALLWKALNHSKPLTDPQISSLRRVRARQYAARFLCIYPKISAVLFVKNVTEEALTTYLFLDFLPFE